MAKIKDVVAIKSGYANFVELKSAFEASRENADRMAMYRPTKAHRQAFERISRGLFQPADKKFYLLSGSYGTGKSHLSLMAANVLSRSSGDPTIAGFYENYKKLESDAALRLNNIRKDGQYLVAICDYHSGQRFEDAVMKAIFEACAAKGLDAQVDTEFDEAERQLAYWEDQGDKSGIRHFYKDFSIALDSVAPGLSVEQLRTGLKGYDSSLMETFRAAFKLMMGGIEFQAKSGNLIPIIIKLVRGDEFKKRFKGLAIFFDEFGFTLEKANYSKDILQGFMETVCKNEPNVLFVGCIHKDFKAYADRFSQADAAVMSARLTQVDLLNEGIEEIIAAIVETDKHSAIWKDEVATKTAVFDQLLPPCTTLNLFPWIHDVDHMRTRVLEDIYGVHPMALSCVLKLSSELGSDARSTFTFFTGAVGGKEGSYAEFIEKTDITVSGGKLALYTVDQLATFFKDELSQRNPDLREGQRQIVNGFYASLDALRKASTGQLAGMEEDDRLGVLKTILIYLLCQIPASLENLQFGLYCLSSQEKKHVESLLKDLVKTGAVFFRQQSKTYELAAGSGEDPYVLIDRYLADETLHPHDTVAAFLEETADKTADDFLIANNFNLPYADDKRFKTRFVQAKDLGTALWKELESDFASSRSNPAKNFEGTLVYTLCQDDDEISQAKAALSSLASGTVAVTIPHAPMPYAETLLRVKACRYYLSPSATHKITAQTESRLRDILDNPQDGYLTLLKAGYQRMFQGSDSCWYAQNGTLLVDRPQQSHKAADMLCELVYTKRCRIKHPDLNWVHDDRWKTGRNTALKQAVEVLLSAERILIDNGNPDNHGEKRYLEKVLFKGSGALKKSSSEGNVTYFTGEVASQKIQDEFPLLKELCARLERLQSGQGFAVGPFIQEIRGAPYGASDTALILSLAHMLRAYGERITVYKDSTRTIEQPLRTYIDIVSLVSDPASHTEFAIREISDLQQSLVDRLAVAAGATPLMHGQTRTLQSAHVAIAALYSRLPAVSWIITLHEADSQKRLGDLKSLLAEKSGSTDHYGFLLNDLPTLYGHGNPGLTTQQVDAIVVMFEKDIKALENAETQVLHQVAAAVSSLFGTPGDIVECEKALMAWYTSLTSCQREETRYDDSDVGVLLARLRKDGSFTFKIAEALPIAYGFGALRDWTSLHVKDYGDKIRLAKEEIDRAIVVVEKPQIEKPTYEIGDNDSVPVKPPVGASALVYTVDGSDPRQSPTAVQASGSVNLASLIGEQPNVKVTLRALDKDGNYSDPVSVELIDKKHKYDFKFSNDMFAAEATFKCPDDMDGFIAVLGSLLKFAQKKDLLKPGDDAKIEAFVRDLVSKKS